MKKIYSLLIILLFAFNVNAQVWYTFPGKIEPDDVKQYMDSLIQEYSGGSLEQNYSKDDSFEEDSSLQVGTFLLNVNRTLDNLKHAPAFLLNVNSWSINSAGGIEVSYSVVNSTVKKIKYIYVTSYFLNSVGDVCIGDFGGRYMKHKLIGPIGPRPRLNDFWDEAIDKLSHCSGDYTYDTPTFYCSVADRMVVSSVKVQYFDGTVKTYTGKQLDKIVSFESYWSSSEYNPLAPINDY